MGQKEGECGESQSEMELMRSLERCKKYKDQKKFMNQCMNTMTTKLVSKDRKVWRDTINDGGVNQVYFFYLVSYLKLLFFC